MIWLKKILIKPKEGRKKGKREPRIDGTTDNKQQVDTFKPNY